MEEIIFKKIMAKALTDIFDERNRDAFLKLRGEIVAEIKKECVDDLFENVGICKQLVKLRNGEVSHYSLCFYNWEGPKLVPVSDNDSIVEIMENKDKIIDHLVFYKMRKAYEDLNKENDHGTPKRMDAGRH